MFSISNGYIRSTISQTQINQIVSIAQQHHAKVNGHRRFIPPASTINKGFYGLVQNQYIRSLYELARDQLTLLDRLRKGITDSTDLLKDRLKRRRELEAMMGGGSKLIFGASGPEKTLQMIVVPDPAFGNEHPVNPGDLVGMIAPENGLNYENSVKATLCELVIPSFPELSRPAISYQADQPAQPPGHWVKAEKYLERLNQLAKFFQDRLDAQKEQILKLVSGLKKKSESEKTVARKEIQDALLAIRGDSTFYKSHIENSRKICIRLVDLCNAQELQGRDELRDQIGEKFTQLAGEITSFFEELNDDGETSNSIYDRAASGLYRLFRCIREEQKFLDNVTLEQMCACHDLAIRSKEAYDRVEFNMGLDCGAGSNQFKKIYAKLQRAEAWEQAQRETMSYRASQFFRRWFSWIW